MLINLSRFCSSGGPEVKPIKIVSFLWRPSPGIEEPIRKRAGIVVFPDFSGVILVTSSEVPQECLEVALLWATQLTVSALLDYRRRQITHTQLSRAFTGTSGNFTTGCF
ncbi:hypothetical protein RRG08_042580 [Elysia crispata]|uniref:Uncharacterized protein n=1 Tax=Elysia crispata TaxID=231223 RepID=A0AAE1CKL9_9GAST|nr:hypothetical protein RRG08_042580 [Elysia crispata]